MFMLGLENSFFFSLFYSRTDNAERRRQIIEESKYLGGDLEHTHLVKGLDYALLQKIKAEQEKKEEDQDEDDENQDDKEDKDEENEDREMQKSTDEEDEDEDDVEEEDKLKANLKPKISSKSATAALAAALNNNVKDPIALKKYVF